ncbi:MAG: intradiol ring-cleavage dioxygenase [Sphingobacteriaceae bacterium]|nr:MAG: intradiol ring-cleavage dioxygenase [Sphingobacteriaceae bacterium]
MERKKFLKNLTLATLSFSLLESCTRQATSQTCALTPEETDGPFPTHLPASFTTQNIVGDRVGMPLQIRINLKNTNNKCEPLAAARIDIWHCDSKGDYSEYGGQSAAPPNRMNEKEPPHGPPPGGFRDSAGHHGPPPGGPGGPPPGGGGMQATDYTKKHFLRGRQITDHAGLVVYKSIYPGWYSGRATHIHAHIFDEKGTSLLITQIAFPEQITQEVYKSGVYAKRGLSDTSNKEDNVFQDSVANELAVLTGNLKDGYTLEHTIYVKS